MKRFLLAAAATVGMAVLCAPVWAQGRSFLYDLSLEELFNVKVEARRREESAVDVPMSIEILTKEELFQTQTDNTADLQFFVPGLFTGSGVDAHSTRIFIRGIGSVVPVVDVDSAVPVYVDDVFIPSALGMVDDIQFFERVEVLRGPQGTLYGRNSLGGAIKYYTKPLTDDTEVELMLGTGSERARDLKYELRTPLINDHLWGGFSYAHLEHDGYQSLIHTGGEGWGENSDHYMAKLRLEPFDDLSFKLKYQRADKDAPAKYLKTIPGTQINPETGHAGFLDFLQDTTNGGVQLGTNLLPSTDIDEIESDLQFNSEKYTETFRFEAKLAVSDTVSLQYIGSLGSYQGIRGFDIDGAPTPFLQVYENFITENESHEFQLLWNTDSLDFLLGLYFYREDNKLRGHTVQTFSGLPSGWQTVNDPFGNATGVTVGEYELRNSELNSDAIYTSISYALNDKLNITAGLRYTRDKREFIQGEETLWIGDDYYTGNVEISDWGPPPDDAETTDISGNFASDQGRWSEATPEFSLAYHTNENTLYYGSYRQGFLGGTLHRNIVPELNEPSKTSEQTVDAFELGIKANLPERQVNFTGAIYYNQFNDMVVGVRVAEGPSALGYVDRPTNAGEARSYGFELEGQAQITDSWQVKVALAHTNFKLVEVASLDVDAKATNISDTFMKEQVLTPEWSGILYTRYRLPFSFPGKFHFWVNARYRTEMNANAAVESSGSIAPPQSSSKAVDDYLISDEVWDVSTGLHFIDSRQQLQLSLVVNNLLDERTMDQVLAVSEGFLGVIGGYNKPRTWSFVVSYAY